MASAAEGLAPARRWSPPEEFDEYRLQRPLGTGRSGRVFLALDTLLERTVAVKFIPAPDGTWLSRFLAEARAAARIQHPNVVTLYRVGQVGEWAYLVSEFVRGETLDRIARPVEWRRALELGSDLARGLSAAHRNGVLHRDLKPGNAILAESGDVKIFDFGLARMTERETPPDGIRLPAQADRQLVGTPYFIAPEVWRGEEATARSDLYSLGALLYELCAGRGPFRQVALGDLPRAVQESDARPLAEAAPGVDGRLAEVIDRCLRREPQQRFASADDLADALEQLRPSLAGAPVPEGNPYRGLQSFDAEHRSLFFGRRRDLRGALDRLRAEPLLVVTGDSGVGKSSLCLAGLLPELSLGLLRDGRNWTTVRLLPGRRPLAALAAALAPVLGTDEEALEDHLRADPVRVSRGLRRHLGTALGLAVYVDQLEELVTVSEVRDAGPAAEALAQLAAGFSGLRVIASARSDFLTRLAGLPGLGEQVPRALYLLRGLRREEIRDAVVGPARAKGVRFESEALISSLVESTAAADGGLPLLQFALAELWRARDAAGGVITASALAAIGGVSGALARHADGVLEHLPPEQRASARRLLLRLVTLDGTRTRRVEEELALDDAARGALEALVRGRLLFARDSEAGVSYEIAHEALVSGWGTLGRWLAEEEEARALRQRLEQAIAEWEESGALFGERQLAEIGGLAHFSPRETAFVEASRRAVRRSRVVRRALAAAFLLALLFVYGGVKLRARLDQEEEIHAWLGRAQAALANAGALSAALESTRAEAFRLFDAHARAPGEAAWDRARELSVRTSAAFAGAAESFERALLLGPGNAEVHEALAEFLLQRALLAERERRFGERDELVRRLRLYDKSGARVRQFEAPALLSIDTFPHAAQVFARRAGGAERLLGTTPLSGVELPAGSYVLELRPASGAAVTYPILLDAGERRHVSAGLPARVPEGFAYVPSGRFLFGSGADESVRQFFDTPPLHAVETAAFLIARHETTYADWIEWLRALPAAERRRRTPHVGSAGMSGQLDLRQVRGKWQLTLQPASRAYVVREGEKLQYARPAELRRPIEWMRLPVAGVSFEDARAYAEWLSHSGRVPGARLCTEQEWERAARGADEREFPHGDRLQPSDADFDLTYGKRPLGFGPDEVGSHPASRSPFGVDDLAGNVWEWTASSLVPGESVARGGSYYSSANTCRATNRELPDPAFRSPIVGVRICANPPSL